MVCADPDGGAHVDICSFSQSNAEKFDTDGAVVSRRLAVATNEASSFFFLFRRSVRIRACPTLLVRAQITTSRW